MECNYCKDNVSMPFTCSLCSQKHCSKHRLPETHECTNVGVYNTDSYRKQKLAKSRLPRNVISTDSISSGGGYGVGRGNYWSSGDRNKDVLYAGLLIGFVSIMRFIFDLSLVLIPGVMIFSIFGMFSIYFVRRRSAKAYGLDTRFMFWPIGIALTLIFSLFRSFWILIGYFFIEGEGTLESRGRIGIISTLTSMGVFFVGQIIIAIFPFMEDTGFIIPSGIFLLISLLNMIPLWGLDGQHLLAWEPKYYWPMLITTLLSVILFRGVVF
ncbi:MAG: hypothetical protein GPJ54_10595 [Candidatus Heimdallarchaeota archaeon]|nr:hypothetical protein [Candidatus Heimdallarchaeota archaeon]